MTRKHFGRELWDRLSTLVVEDDGKPVTELGSWTAEKLFFVGSYLAQVTTAMHGNPNFPGGLVYVDLFCGNGVCVAKDTERLGRFPGSALLAAGCAKPFDHLLFVDQDARNLEVLRDRVALIGPTLNCWYREGDANEVVEEVVGRIPSRSLTVAFIDPWSLGIHFRTLDRITGQRAVDLLILFPDAIELRNVDEYYYPGRSSHLDLQMGDDGLWRQTWDQVRDLDPVKKRQALIQYYLKRLATLGYAYHDAHSIRGSSGPLYRVVYASRDKLGLKFWEIAVKEDLHGQRSLFG